MITTEKTVETSSAQFCLGTNSTRRVYSHLILKKAEEKKRMVCAKTSSFKRKPQQDQRIF